MDSVLEGLKMLLSLHERYTRLTLTEIGAFSFETDIIDGSFANDLCAFTNEFAWVLKIRDFFTWKSEKGIKDYSSFYQSHYDKLSALHCMAHVDDMTPTITHSKVINWLNLMQEISQNGDPDLLQTFTPTFPDEDENIEERLNFTIGDLMDTDEVSIAKYRAIGMILHIIQDSFTASHCKRNTSTLEIEEFYCYRKQSKSIHADNDYVKKVLRDYMLSISYEVLADLIDGHHVDFDLYFPLSKVARASSHGGFV